MMAEILDGKLVSAKIKEEIKLEIEEIKKTSGKIPGLAVVIVGDDPASKVYVKNKRRDCEEVGMYSEEHALPENISEEELLGLVKKLNEEENIHGILVQSPLPKHLNEDIVFENISPEKDVDAFHPETVGRITLGRYNFVPCTPMGVMELLKYYNIDMSGKECVVVGRSNIVGKPMALLLLQANGTVTVCHSRTKDLGEVTKRADILIVAMRQRQFIKADMVKEGAVIVDVGIHKKDDGKLCGDVDFESVAKIASYITPVPGGVGPMTRTMLLKNTLTAFKFKSN
ncbi:MAG: bifunctional methylenetetrahydrofolate dehydrogenase/methenyltetrahydrofolate cyclohydrolase FolD [Oscillospiraceae bacterium]|nr:bifunctional methylenetetrahydrofolate dehydrogenase/methenyltetrahydrofolate cyclohydrolase FolD [Oscillospiraceae bacterium]